MRDLGQIIDDLKRMKPDLYRRYPIRSLGVFGSYVRGDQTEASDLDVLVDIGAGLGLMGLADLRRDLSDGLGVKVDLVTKDALKPEIGSRILSEAVML
ncbi:MAG TPA: nucleotidyltransferase family protein [Stellaceae bacterium]|nr:nucleotidyltransferase family protein [Stellaceae bacterium]